MGSEERDTLIKQLKSEVDVGRVRQDQFNDFFVSLFRMRMSFLKWNVADQSHGGDSETGQRAGERDWTLRDSGNVGDVAIFEALKLSSVDTTVIKKHIDKLIDNYNSQGLTNLFCVVYYEGANFGEFWPKYVEHLALDATAGDLACVDWKEFPEADSASLRSLLLVYRKNGLPIYVHHIAMQFGASGSV